MKPTPEELQKILADHVLWLRGDGAGKRANLSGANLSSADLSGADLRSAYLSGANLSSADLRSANLSGADLSSANLSGANLRSAYLSSANLSGANLRSAYLSGANLRSANLSSADLRSAYLSGANLSSADLSGADQEKNPVPAIAGLHQKILAAIDGGGTLNMSEWHTCETTHCRAGWVVHLAGEVGRVMEHFLSTPVAAALIELASEPALEGKVPDYYCGNEAALADIKRLADIQAKRSAEAPAP